MKVNREQFLAAALLLSAVTGCDKLKGKETAKAAPETVASAQLANDPSTAATTAPAAEAADSLKAGPATAGNSTKNARAKVGTAPSAGVVAPGGEVIPVVGPGKEVVAPGNEGIVAPGKEVIAPGNEVAPVVAPANENIPTAPTGGTPMHIPKGRGRGAT